MAPELTRPEDSRSAPYAVSVPVATAEGLSAAPTV
jgi:hypothetical protein